MQAQFDSLVIVRDPAVGDLHSLEQPIVFDQEDYTDLPVIVEVFV